MFIEAVQLASQLHSSQQKKRSIVPNIPYMAHLLEVAGIVQANGGDETTVAAALLHDAIEDQGIEARDSIRETCGPEVLQIVEACTESETFPKPPWKVRKQTYLDLVERASLRTLLIIVADKLQNSRALLRRLKLEGSRGWGKPSREEKLWYFHNLLAAMRRRLVSLQQETNHPTLVSLSLLVEEYSEVVTALSHY